MTGCNRKTNQQETFQEGVLRKIPGNKCFRSSLGTALHRLPYPHPHLPLGTFWSLKRSVNKPMQKAPNGSEGGALAFLVE